MQGNQANRIVTLVNCLAIPEGSGPPQAHFFRHDEGFLFLVDDEVPPSHQIVYKVATFKLRGAPVVNRSKLIVESEEPIADLCSLELIDGCRPHHYEAYASPYSMNSVLKIAGARAGDAMGIELIQRFDPPVQQSR